MTKTNSKSSQLKIPAKDVLNIFQISNPRIFIKYKNDNDTRNIYQNALKMLDFFGAPTANVLEDKNSIKEITATVSCSEGTGFIMTIELMRVTQMAEIENWFIMIIGDTKGYSEEANSPSEGCALIPQFILTGLIENNSVFVPRDCICRKQEENGDSSLFLPDNSNDFYACILYADAAFRAVILEENMDIEKFGNYLEPFQIKMAHHAYNEIKNRTPVSLAQYIVDNQDPKTSGLPPPPFAAPRMLQ